MNRDILAVIQENMNTFSKGQKRIANYILESYDKAAFMTASRLGKRVNVSESTVVRFAAELGYDGYPSMQKSLQKMIRNRLTSVQRIEVANDRIGDQNGLDMVLQSYYRYAHFGVTVAKFKVSDLNLFHFSSNSFFGIIPPFTLFAICLNYGI